MYNVYTRPVLHYRKRVVLQNFTIVSQNWQYYLLNLRIMISLLVFHLNSFLFFYRFHSLNTRTANSTDGSRSPNWANTIALFASTKAIDPHTDFPTSLIVMTRSWMNRIIHITMALIIYFLMCSIYQRPLLVVNNFILWNAKKEKKKMQQKCTITLKLKRRTTSADHHNIVQMYLTRLTRFKTSWV